MPRIRALAFTLALAAFSAPAGAPRADEPASAPAPEKKWEFETYQLVLLKRGPAWTPEVTPATQELQRQHIAHLEKMGAEGKIVLAGPFGDQTDPALRGACIYRVGSAAEARALAEGDPAVKAGRLAVEVVTWAVGKGYVAFPKAPPAAGR